MACRQSQPGTSCTSNPTAVTAWFPPKWGLNDRLPTTFGMIAA